MVYLTTRTVPPIRKQQMAKTGNRGTHFALIAPHGPTQAWLTTSVFYNAPINVKPQGRGGGADQGNLTF